MSQDFQTIATTSEGLYKEKGSKFLAYAFPVSNLPEVQSHLEMLRKKHYDARHHCYAYRIGLEDQHFRANDDGEPAHSAGDPILGQIRSLDLTNVLVVVVRYFGGTKLGLGGLIKAYGTAAKEALNKVHKLLIYPTDRFVLTFEYEHTNAVERVLSHFEIQWEDKAYETNCVFKGALRKSQHKLLVDEIEELRLKSVSIVTL